VGDGVWIRNSDASFEFYASLLEYKVLTVWSRHTLASSKEFPIQREGLGSGLWCCHDGDEVAPGIDEGDVRCRRSLRWRRPQAQIEDENERDEALREDVDGKVGLR
jgi:hypothetical protein